MDKNKLIKPLILIFVIILFCSVLSRVFSRSETLTEYAEKNPEIAYREKESEEGPGKGTAESAEQVSDKDADKSQERVSDKNMEQKPDMADTISEKEGNISADAVSNGDTENVSDTLGNEEDSMSANPERTVYKTGFYYEPLSDEMIKRITGISYPAVEGSASTAANAVNTAASLEDVQISYDELCYVSVLHYNFHGVERTGELICNRAIAQDMVEIFYELYRNEYQIEQIRLIDEYSGDDTLSMQDNNTSCFNYRVVDGTSNLSKHALGLAIDINPFFNPYVVFQKDGSTYISPQGSETYADRSNEFAYKIDENDLCFQLFKEHGFIWGGDWNSCKDYQHFQKALD